MRSTDKLHISGLDTLADGVENITFSEFISDIPHDNFVETWGFYDFNKLRREIKSDGQKSNLARPSFCDI